ncbi:HAD family phosphatase [Parabacteroides sp. PF5-6]|uniref:HAD family hydrolase n=1 Tax=Parabacteroides sp. PF5-6 TaxID=1742403 RepID=UPI0024076D5B|nr:HAD family phosphatase [Parabacteroides sp. PF5-6]MDF9830388.1 FMN phosphatase YigB (HAD superfamily) [Parabacteroides sp. PF5-6]
MDGIKNLLIDFGGVIINLTRNRCIEAFAQLGVDVHEQLGSIYHHKDLFMHLEIGELSPAAFRDGIRQRSNRILTDKEIDDAWIAMLADVPDYKLDLLLRLKEEYNTFLLSNTNSIHWEWAKQNIFNYKGHRVDDFFHKIYLSYELHLEKPNPEIFEYVLNDAGISPHETLFIDDAAVNCKAAEALGIRTYTPEPREDWSFLFER